jgi:MarR family transcriptional regulator, transcriptional regulator for hemolysin
MALDDKVPGLEVTALRFAEPAESASVESDVLNLLHDVARQTSSCADAMVQTLGVTHAQLLILALVERQSYVSLSELASLAGVTPPTIGRLVFRLERLGLVERYPDPKDRRIWRVRLTPSASPVLWQMKLLRPKLYRTVTDGIDPRVIELMMRGLNRMKENASACRSAGRSSEEEMQGH